MKIGIYGGTFDPAHHAHLILAREASEDFGLAKVIFVPAAISPDKSAPLASGDLRLRMLRAATAGESLFEVDDCELQRPPPSYTIDTIEVFRERYRGSELYLLVGDDNLAGLPTWKRFAELEKMVKIVVLPRTNAGVRHNYLAVTRRIDISATEVRQRVALRKSISYFVPARVAEIIYTNHLYMEVNPSNPKS